MAPSAWTGSAFISTLVGVLFWHLGLEFGCGPTYTSSDGCTSGCCSPLPPAVRALLLRLLPCRVLLALLLAGGGASRRLLWLLVVGPPSSCSLAFVRLVARVRPGLRPPSLARRRLQLRVETLERLREMEGTAMSKMTKRHEGAEAGGTCG